MHLVTYQTMQVMQTFHIRRIPSSKLFTDLDLVMSAISKVSNLNI